MLKARFIDKILEVMADEAERIYIDKKEVSVYFKNSRDVEGNAEILKHIYTLQLNKVVEDYRVSIDYELKTIEIHRKSSFVCLRNFNSCNNKIWTTILEDIDPEEQKLITNFIEGLNLSSQIDMPISILYRNKILDIYKTKKVLDILVLKKGN